MLLNAVYMHPVEYIYVYVVGGLTSFDIPFNRVYINCIRQYKHTLFYLFEEQTECYLFQQYKKQHCITTQRT